MDAKFTEITMNNVHAYKVMGGSNSIASSFNIGENWLFRIIEHSDWQALYLQFQREHVLGTIPYRWEPNGWDMEYDCIQYTTYTECTLYDVCFEELHHNLQITSNKPLLYPTIFLLILFHIHFQVFIIFLYHILKHEYHLLRSCLWLSKCAIYF